MVRNHKGRPLDSMGRRDDDQILWEKVTQSVKRMNPQPVFQPSEQKRHTEIELRTQRLIVRSQSVRSGQFKAKIAPFKSKPADFRLNETSGIDRSSARRMKRGQMKIEDRLDLHGLSQEQAHRKLNAFIGRAVRQNFRYVLIITGKGRDGHGILRQKVPTWLKEAPLCHHLNAISYAQPQDGGTGALYIRLKRQREGTR